VVILHTFSQYIYRFYLQIFYGTYIKSIVIPNSVTEIHKAAFYLSGLEEVSFEANSQLTTIGDEAFKSTNITSIEIPKDVKPFGQEVFSYTPCDDRTVFQPGNAVKNCKLVTSAPTTASPTTSAPSTPTIVPPTTTSSAFSPVLRVTVIVFGVVILSVILYALFKRVTSPASQDNHVLDKESGPVAADNIQMPQPRGQHILDKLIHRLHLQQKSKKFHKISPGTKGPRGVEKQMRRKESGQRKT